MFDNIYPKICVKLKIYLKIVQELMYLFVELYIKYSLQNILLYNMQNLLTKKELNK